MREVKKLLDEELFIVENIDATIIAQRPKMAPYLQEKMVDVTSTSESMTHLRKLISILASDILDTANCR